MVTKLGLEDGRNPMKKLSITLTGMAMIFTLSACSSGPDPKVAAKAITKAHDKYATCLNDQVENENSDDSFLSALGWELAQTCHDEFVTALGKIKVDEKFKSDRDAVIALETQLSSQAGAISANTDNITNYNTDFSVYKATESQATGALTKLFLDYEIPLN